MGFPDAKWAVDQIVSKLGIRPSNMRSFLAVPLSRTSVGLKFLEPQDSYYGEGGALAAVTKGVMIRMSAEDYPESVADGTLVVNNTNLGAYEDSYYTVSNLTQGQEYYFTAFPYTDIGVYNENLNAANRASCIPRNVENVNVTISVDNERRFNSTTVTLINLTAGTQSTHQFDSAGSFVFSVNSGNTYKVTASTVEGYKLDYEEFGPFVAATGGVKNLEFNFEMCFLYAIKFDNGGDGIPSSFEYLEDCAGFTQASVSSMNSWAGSRILDKFRPCLIKPGKTAPEYYLNKNNYNQRATGSVAPVLTGADGDVMVEVEKMWYKVVENPIELTATLYISEVQLTGYKSFIGNQDVAYRGAYEASISGSAMRSVSGVAPAVGKTRASFRSDAAARGNEYSQNDYYLVRLWQCMYLLLYGTRDSQTALGMGRSKSTNTSAINTGTMNDKPFCWGDTTATNGVKFLGVENFYGNVWEYVDGLTIVNYIQKITEDPSKYDDIGTSYEISAGAVPIDASGSYIKSVYATNDGLFLPSVLGGSANTYFTDGAVIQSSTGTRVAQFGGRWSNGGMVGAFCWNLGNEATSLDANFGSRLCRRKVSS